MKLSLLDIAQDIANDLDSDEFNSIDDTVESLQIAQIIKSTYFAMMSNRNWPHLNRAVQLIASTTTALPTHMKLAEEVKQLSFINYDKKRLDMDNKNYVRMTWLEPDDFLRVLNNRRSDNANVDTIIDTSGIELFIYNDKGPTYYTSFDDDTIVFDSYDSAVESTLQGSNVQAQAFVMPQWSMSDSFIPDLPSEAFMALVEEAKSRASMKLRQVQDIKSEQEAQRQHRFLSQKAWRVKGGIKYPDYGRRGRTYHRDPTFRSGN